MEIRMIAQVVKASLSASNAASIAFRAIAGTATFSTRAITPVRSPIYRDFLCDFAIGSSLLIHPSSLFGWTLFVGGLYRKATPVFWKLPSERSCPSVCFSLEKECFKVLPAICAWRWTQPTISFSSLQELLSRSVTGAVFNYYGTIDVV